MKEGASAEEGKKHHKLKVSLLKLYITKQTLITFIFISNRARTCTHCTPCYTPLHLYHALMHLYHAPMCRYSAPTVFLRSTHSLPHVPLSTNTRPWHFHTTLVHCAITCKPNRPASPCLPTGVRAIIVTRLVVMVSRLVVMVSRIVWCVTGLLETGYRAHPRRCPSGAPAEHWNSPASSPYCFQRHFAYATIL